MSKLRLVVLIAALPLSAAAQDGPSKQETLSAMRKAADFYRSKVSTEGGYHFYYAADLSYGRSESAEGPTQVENQREATPVVGMAYLDAYDATGDRMFLDAARAAAMSFVRGQLCSGGWDYLIEFDPAKRGEYDYRENGPCGQDALGTKKGVTNLDDNVTQAVLRQMMRVDQRLNFSDAKIHEAIVYALDHLIAAQYPIGAWPQRFKQPPDAGKFPVKKASYPDSWSRKWPGPNYQSHYTFNDNTIPDVIDMFLEAARIYKEPKYLAAAEKGGQFILMAQMPDPQPAWAQQYDADMHPAWARIFEPPAVTGGESQGVMRILMTLYRETGNKKYLDPIPKALDYLQKSYLPRGTAETFRRIPASDPVLARFYELKTNRPLYVTKGTRVTAQGLGTRLVDGYEVTYSPDSVINHYGVLISGRELGKIRDEYNTLAAADPKSARRADRLTGLSPWVEQSRGVKQTPDGRKVRSLIQAMDSRGAWKKRGTVGKADRLVLVFAAKDMVLRVGPGSASGLAVEKEDKRQVIQVHENDTIEVFQGAQPPVQEIITSQDFAENLGAMARYYANAR